jgi:DNA-directed RNA polymerase III subunit RPC8
VSKILLETLIFVIAYHSTSEPEEGVWVWHNNTNEGEEDQLYFDNGNTVRLRVEAEHWTDQAPDGSKKAGETNGDVVKRKVPYRIEGSMAEPGLGDVMWW